MTSNSEMPDEIYAGYDEDEYIRYWQAPEDPSGGYPLTKYIRPALSAPAREWLPIETAPKSWCRNL